MNVDTWIYGRLDTIADVGGRITPEIGDQDSAKPYFVYKLVTEEPIQSHDIPLQATRNWHYQITAVAETDTEARILAEQAKTAMVINNDGAGLQSCRLVPGGSGKHFDPETNDRENYFTVSIWENFS